MALGPVSKNQRFSNFLINKPMKEASVMAYKEYKVLYVTEGGLGTIFLGASGIPVKRLEMTLNKEAADGWTLVFQFVEQKRFLLFWKREAVIITLAR